MAAPAGRVAAVLGQQHADVHLVGLALEVLEKALDAVPLLVPLAVPVGRAVDDPVLLLLRELVPGRVARNARSLGVAHQVVLALGPRRGLDGLDGASTQRELVVRDHQAVVDPDHAPEAAADFAGAHGRVEREHGRDRVAVAQVTLRAVQAGGELPHVRRRLAARFGQHIDRHATAAALERGLDGLDHPCALGMAEAEPVGHHIEHFARTGRRGHLAFGLHLGEAAGREPLRHLFFAGATRQLDRKRQDQPRLVRCIGARGLGRRLHTRLQSGVDAVGGVVPHGQRRLTVVQLGRTRIKQLEVVVELGHRANRGARGAHRVGLVDGNRRWHAFHPVDRGFVHAVQELARIGTEGFHVTTLTFGIQRVEHQAGFAGSAGTGNHRQLAGPDIEIEVLEVVLACAADADGPLGHGCGLSLRSVEQARTF